MRISGFFLIVPAVAAFLAHLLEGTKTLRSLRKDRNTQKSSLISKEKVNKVMSGGGGGTGEEAPSHIQVGLQLFMRAPSILCVGIVYHGPLNRGVSNGGVSRSGLVLPFLSFFVLFCPFWDFPDFSGIFPNCSGMVRGFSRIVLFLFLGLLRAPTRNSPERVRDTIWTFPEKSGKHPGLETPRFSFSQVYMRLDC